MLRRHNMGKQDSMQYHDISKAMIRLYQGLESDYVKQEARQFQRRNEAMNPLVKNYISARLHAQRSIDHRTCFT